MTENCSDLDREELIEKLSERHMVLNEQANEILELINGLKLHAIDPEDLDLEEVLPDEGD